MSVTSEQDFEYIRKLVLDRAAIVLEPGKVYLAESRLVPVARKAGLSSLRELVDQLRAERNGGGLTTQVVEAMTTNETSFFRDVHPFDALKRAVLPPLLEARATQRSLTIWCAAASTGQEPYTIAMVLREHFPQLANWTITFIATDIASEILARARAGRYSQLEINRGLPATLLVKYFKKEGVEWVVKDELRKMIDFREMNLATAWPQLPPLDIVFIRNVLIYFDVEMKKQILGKVERLLRPDGVVFLGGAETTLNLGLRLERVPHEKTSFYRLGGSS